MSGSQTREIRTDPITGEQVILSADRPVERRPVPYAEGDEIAPADCPFCPGNEAHTRPTIAELRRNERWVARAFANRRPALIVEETLGTAIDGPFGVVSGVGAHEVLVEAPEHAPLHHLPVERTEDALGLAASRLADLRQDRRLATLVWFRNHGTAAGASQPHPHAQIVGLPTVPPRIAAVVRRAQEAGGSLQRQVLDAEHRDGRRVLLTEEGITALCPFAPRHPFEIWLVPERTTAGLADATEAEIAALARAMRRCAAALAAVLGEVPTTTTIVGPPERLDGPAIGWHVRLAPRLTTAAGLEEATGVTVHSVLPEEAARLLRVPLADAI